jgi:hypothetical protein|tara:strand:+ start:90 stop:296 length:207 start_codon:yes stop_codon:yes gene_type:complete
MIIFPYKSKKELKEMIGTRLNVIETSMFGNEYVPNGTMTGANRPHITNMGREFFAQVTVKDGIITGVK